MYGLTPGELNRFSSALLTDARQLAAQGNRISNGKRCRGVGGVGGGVGGVDDVGGVGYVGGVGGGVVFYDLLTGARHFAAQGNRISDGKRCC